MQKYWSLVIIQQNWSFVIILYFSSLEPFHKHKFVVMLNIHPFFYSILQEMWVIHLFWAYTSLSRVMFISLSRVVILFRYRSLISVKRLHKLFILIFFRVFNSLNILVWSNQINISCVKLRPILGLLLSIINLITIIKFFKLFYWCTHLGNTL